MSKKPAILKSSQAIRSIVFGQQTINVAWASETNAWRRKLCAPELQEEFVQVLGKHKEPLPPGTTGVAMKESEHVSDGDPRPHYTAYCLDGAGKTIQVIHLIKDGDEVAEKEEK
ncbi:hypothetical protein G7Y79_00017g042050 [Physcia stellaris]|nr:hypothetical protein G7Y79_00017g042050 [Physcia stellaris]